jgi:hypothetical protein
VFAGRNKPRYKKHDFAFRGLLTCAHDECSITAEIKKGCIITAPRLGANAATVGLSQSVRTRQCMSCHTKISIPVGKFQGPPTRCAVCDSPQWVAQGSEDYLVIVEFGKSIQGQANANQGAFAMRLQLSGGAPSPRY